MSLEQAIKELTEAVRENTAAHQELVAVAKKTAAGKAPAKSAPATDEGEGEAEAPAKKAPAKKAPAKKAPAKKAPAKKKDPEVVTEIEAKALRAKAKDWMSVDDADERDARKERFAAALNHLGAAKLSDLDDEDQAKMASYINVWEAGEEIEDFEAIDALVEEKVGGDDGDSDDGDSDEMLG